MPSFSKNDVVVVRYPFSDLTAIKVRPAVIVGIPDRSPDYLIVPLTSKTSRLGAGEFALADWRGAGLNVPSAVKRGILTIHSALILKLVGGLSPMTRVGSNSRFVCGWNCRCNKLSAECADQVHG